MRDDARLMRDQGVIMPPYLISDGALSTMVSTACTGPERPARLESSGCGSGGGAASGTAAA